MLSSYQIKTHNILGASLSAPVAHDCLYGRRAPSHVRLETALPRPKKIKTFPFERYGTVYQMRIVAKRYSQNKTLAVELLYEEDGIWEPYLVATANIPETERFAGNYKAFIDPRYLGSDLPGWLRQQGIAEDAGLVIHRREGNYPLMEFDRRFINSVATDGYKENMLEEG